MPTTEISQAFKDNKYPPFIKNHAIFKQVKTVQKIFPLIGLSNCEEKVVVDNSAEVKRYAFELLNEISRYLLVRANQFLYTIGTETLRDVLRHFAEACLQIEAIKNNGSKISLHIPINISYAGKVVFKAGEGLFKAYNKLIKLVGDKISLLPMESATTYFKVFSSANIPSTGNKLVFSSDGSDGLWDIATMSMRGISSCQSWSSENAKHLVGSMLDPFTGILYITSGGKFGDVAGTKMVRRCILRFVVDPSGTQRLLLERMYPAYDANIAATFKKFLERKTGGKVPVVDYGLGATVSDTLFAPCSNTIRSLPVDNRPYCDSRIEYATDRSDVLGVAKERVDGFLVELPGSVGVKILTQFRLLTEKLPPKQQATLDMICGRNGDISYLVYDYIGTLLIKHTAKLGNDLVGDKVLSAKKEVSALLDEGLTAIVKYAVTKALKEASGLNFKCTKASHISDEVIAGICKVVSKQMMKDFATRMGKLANPKLTKKKASKKTPLYISLLAA